MSTTQTALNFVPVFNCPTYGGGSHPVSLTLHRDARHGQLRLQAWTNEEGYLEPWSTLSVVVHDGVTLYTADGTDKLFIRDYDANEGCLRALTEQGFITPTGRTEQPAGSFVAFPEAQLTAKGKALAPELFEDGAG